MFFLDFNHDWYEGGIFIDSVFMVINIFTQNVLVPKRQREICLHLPYEVSDY